MFTLDHKIPPPVIALIITAIMWGLSSYLPSLSLDIDLHHIPTVTLVFIGVMFDLLGLLAFRRLRTTIDPLNPDKASTLVTSGVYRITRNPMYVGLAILLLSWAVHLAMLCPFVGPILFVLYINRFQVIPEEQAMRRNFDQEFKVYADRVWRWL